MLCVKILEQFHIQRAENAVRIENIGHITASEECTAAMKNFSEGSHPSAFSSYEMNLQAIEI
ncbi:MAG TPA: hypothetical protein DDW14_00805 [Spirochaetaceae bacterium]|nr:hypothetical protein [Spirochaetaceae bacterium]